MITVTATIDEQDVANALYLDEEDFNLLTLLHLVRENEAMERGNRIQKHFDHHVEQHGVRDMEYLPGMLRRMADQLDVMITDANDRED